MRLSHSPPPPSSPSPYLQREHILRHPAPIFKTKTKAKTKAKTSTTGEKKPPPKKYSSATRVQHAHAHTPSILYVFPHPPPPPPTLFLPHPLSAILHTYLSTSPSPPSHPPPFPPFQQTQPCKCYDLRSHPPRAVSCGCKEVGAGGRGGGVKGSYCAWVRWRREAVCVCVCVCVCVWRSGVVYWESGEETTTTTTTAIAPLTADTHTHTQKTTAVRSRFCMEKPRKKIPTPSPHNKKSLLKNKENATKSKVKVNGLFSHLFLSFLLLSPTPPPPHNFLPPPTKKQKKTNSQHV